MRNVESIQLHLWDAFLIAVIAAGSIGAVVGHWLLTAWCAFLLLLNVLDTFVNRKG